MGFSEETCCLAARDEEMKEEHGDPGSQELGPLGRGGVSL